MKDMRTSCINFLKKFEGKKLEDIILKSDNGIFVYNGFYRDGNTTKNKTHKEPIPSLPRSDYTLLSQRAGYLMGILGRRGIDTVRNIDSEDRNYPSKVRVYIVPEGKNQEYKPFFFS